MNARLELKDLFASVPENLKRCVNATTRCVQTCSVVLGTQLQQVSKHGNTLPAAVPCRRSVLLPILHAGLQTPDVNTHIMQYVNNERDEVTSVVCQKR